MINPPKHGHSHGISLYNSEGMTNEESSERARANWAKLRGHVKMMNIRANFMVKFLDEEEEMLRQMGNKPGNSTEGFSARNKQQVNKTIGS